jgi:hypothetical protein
MKPDGSVGRKKHPAKRQGVPVFVAEVFRPPILFCGRLPAKAGSAYGGKAFRYTCPYQLVKKNAPAFGGGATICNNKLLHS